MVIIRTTIFFSFFFLFFSPFVQLAADDARRREGFEIIIGGDYSPPPQYEEDCPPPPPPPPPPPCQDPKARLNIALATIKKFRAKITSDPKNILKTWTGDNPCTYKGFVCANLPLNDQYSNLSAVAGVDFNGFQFAGCGDDFTLHDLLHGLPDITIFHANSNFFKGNVPEIDRRKLRYLFELDLSNNQLQGTFPNQVLDAKLLTFVDLRFNYFAGQVPPGIFNLDVDVIFLNNNNFEQQLPANLGSTPALYLTFANNKFTGSIPGSIGRSRNLLEVLFLNNQLSGCLPYEIGYLKQSTVFDVGHNQLTGPIPHSFGCLDKMEILNLAQNKFYGAVPETLCDLPNLSNLSLSHNYFTQVGPKCRKLIAERKMDVKMNCILGLPKQKTEQECTWFFSTVRTCPDPQSLLKVPCGRYPSSRPTASKPSAMRTYDTLVPSRP